MSETQHYHTNQRYRLRLCLDNLTPREQDSLAVGERYRQSKKDYWLVSTKMQKTRESLCRVETGDNAEQEETETASAEEQPEDKPTLSDGATLITSATDEFYDNNGQISEETLNKFVHVK